MTGDSHEKIILQNILLGNFWIARVFVGDLNNLHRGTETGVLSSYEFLSCHVKFFLFSSKNKYFLELKQALRYNFADSLSISTKKLVVTNSLLEKNLEWLLTEKCCKFILKYCFKKAHAIGFLQL